MMKVDAAKMCKLTLRQLTICSTVVVYDLYVSVTVHTDVKQAKPNW